MSDDIQSWLDYKEEFGMTTFTNPHERVEQLMLTVERLEEALGLIAVALAALEVSATQSAKEAPETAAKSDAEEQAARNEQRSQSYALKTKGKQ